MNIEIILNFLLNQIYKILLIQEWRLDILLFKSDINNISSNDIENILYELVYYINNIPINKKFILNYILENEYITTDLYYRINKYIIKNNNIDISIEQLFSDNIEIILIFIHIVFYILSNNILNYNNNNKSIIDNLLLNYNLDSDEIYIFKNFINSDICDIVKQYVLAYTPYLIFYKYILISNYDEIIKLINLCSNYQLILLKKNLLSWQELNLSDLIDKNNINKIQYFINNISINNFIEQSSLYSINKLYYNLLNNNSFIEINTISSLNEFILKYDNNNLSYKLCYPKNIFLPNWIYKYNNNVYDEIYYNELIKTIYNNILNKSYLFNILEITKCCKIIELQIYSKLYELLLYTHNICYKDINFKVIDTLMIIFDIFFNILDIDINKEDELIIKIKNYINYSIIEKPNKLTIKHLSLNNTTTNNTFYTKYLLFKNKYKNVMKNITTIARIRIY